MTLKFNESSEKSLRVSGLFPVNFLFVRNHHAEIIVVKRHPLSNVVTTQRGRKLNQDHAIAAISRPLLAMLTLPNNRRYI